MKMLCDLRYAEYQGHGRPPITTVRKVIVEAGGDMAPGMDEVRAAIKRALGDDPIILTVRPVSPGEYPNNFRINGEQDRTGKIVPDAEQPEDLTVLQPNVGETQGKTALSETDVQPTVGKRRPGRPRKEPVSE